MQTKRKAY